MPNTVFQLSPTAKVHITSHFFTAATNHDAAAQYILSGRHSQDATYATICGDSLSKTGKGFHGVETLNFYINFDIVKV